jgi:hypothetical protein
MSKLLVLAVHKEPRALTLGCTILEMYRKEKEVGVLGRNLVQGWFYSRPSSMTAEIGMWEVGHGRMKYGWNGLRSNFSLLCQFVIHSFMWLSSRQ